ncbi:MAG: hypothetical protein AAFN30_10415, partial [Actinomycetota bacterium]
MIEGEPRRRWRSSGGARRAVVLATFVLLAACSDDGNSGRGIAVAGSGSTTPSTTSSTSISTTTIEGESTSTTDDAPSTTPTSAPSGRTPAEQQLWDLYVIDGAPRLRGDGFGPFDFGTDVDDVLLDAEEAGLRVPRDTGWIDKSDVCAESGTGDYRQIEFERPKVQLSFTPDEGLVDWIVDDEFSPLETDFGIRIGATVAEVEDTYGALLDTDGVGPIFELDPDAGGVFAVDGLVGITSSVDDDGRITAMWAGPDGC